jgi:inorganic pyrophosphatase
MTTEISAGSDLPNDFNTIIEIPAHVCGVKYEYNKDSGMLEVDRFMTSAMHYPCNYGFIPQTLAEDGDPTDVLLVTPFPIQAGCLVRARPIGVLQMEDEAGRDDKILAVPLVKACPQYASWESLDDVPQLLKDQLEHFFNHYKDLDKDKWVKVQGWEDCATAKKSITDAEQRYKNK